jgi:hypothetical protein
VDLPNENTGTLKNLTMLSKNDSIPSINPPSIKLMHLSIKYLLTMIIIENKLTLSLILKM